MKIVKNKFGFTVLELLIVISLMGILMAIVFASIDHARELGEKDTIESYFATLKTQSERYYNKYNKFSPSGVPSLCYDESLGFGGLGGLIKNIEDASGASEIELGNEKSGDWNTVTCHTRSDSSIDKWVVEAPTKDSTKDSPKMYCIDSTSGYLMILNGVLSPGPLGSDTGFSCNERISNASSSE